ncbi:MAG: HigA family addiction module antitoxin [Roseiarcus sp.]
MSMRMKNPPHPGELVRDNVEALGLTVAEAAAGLGISRQQLHRIVKGAHGVTPEMAVRLEQAFGGSADFWLRMQISYDLAEVRGRAEPIRLERLRPKAA